MDINGVLICQLKWSHLPDQHQVTNPLRIKAVKMTHEVKAAAHLGVCNTLVILRGWFLWPRDKCSSSPRISVPSMSTCAQTCPNGKLSCWTWEGDYSNCQSLTWDPYRAEVHIGSHRLIQEILRGIPHAQPGGNICGRCSGQQVLPQSNQGTQFEKTWTTQLCPRISWVSRLWPRYLLRPPTSSCSNQRELYQWKW